ncbi:hypothetical protein, partial [Escherichia coli]|uniref:hypothetical protein n=1 Tax=Escherichia coli TaxID=562 RepID=UPI0013C35D5C
MNKALNELAAGNMKESLQTVRMIKVKSNDEMKAFSDNFNKAVSQLTTMIEKVQASSQSLIEATRIIAENILSAQRSSQDIAANVSQIAKGSDTQK